jgi:hypothetical protein
VGSTGGDVSKHFDVYVSDATGEIPHYEAGATYVVMAKHLTDLRTRTDSGLAKDAVVFTPNVCNPSESATGALLADLGAGRLPR